jgi:hypothetical protein
MKRIAIAFLVVLAVWLAVAPALAIQPHRVGVNDYSVSWCDGIHSRCLPHAEKTPHG